MGVPDSDFRVTIDNHFLLGSIGGNWEIQDFRPFHIVTCLKNN